MGIIKKWLKLDTLPITLLRILLIVSGVSVIFMRRSLQDNVHYVVGIAILLVSGSILFRSIRKKEYLQRNNHMLPTAVVGLILGIMVIVNERDSIPFIAIAWGINGLECGALELSHAIHARLHKEKYLIKLIHASLEVILALALVFDPHEALGKHIIILGLEMILQAFTAKNEFYRPLPEANKERTESHAEKN